MSKKKPSDGKIRNKRARFDYDLGDDYLVGIVLNGREAKSLRMSHGQLQGAYVTIKGDPEELYLINASIHGTKGIPIDDQEVTQARKLLAKRKEIDQIVAAKRQGRTIVPVDIITKGRYIKLRIAVGKGKKHYDKRSTLKERDDSRNAQREIKSSNRY
jgi:SsrA-binding protein